MENLDGGFAGPEGVFGDLSGHVHEPGGEVAGFDAPVSASHEMSDAERERIIDALVASHYDRLVLFVARRIGNRDDALDIAQNTFLEAHRCLPKFAGRSHLSTWLYGIALNLLHSHLARHRRRLEVSIDEFVELAPVEATPCLQVAHEHRTALDRVLGALENAPSDQRETLLLVAIEGLTYEEAALRLDVAIGTVRSRVSRLRTTLRDLLG